VVAHLFEPIAEHVHRRAFAAFGDATIDRLVTVGVEWPRIAAGVVTSMPSAIRCVAAVCRVLWSEVVPMPAFVAIRANAFVAAFGLSWTPISSVNTGRRGSI
jgi:hypothetical protein